MAKISFAQSDRYAVVINEIMADPSPVVGLPNAEYIELRNCSNRIIDLNKWRIEKGTSIYSITSSTLLKPDSLIVLCSKTNLPYFTGIARAVALSSFPVLINEEGLLVLKSSDNKIVHAVEYKKKWHENAIKATGGWSLEMIDPSKPCAENNWTSSKHRNGGTPGNENSIYKIKTVIDQPEALQCIALNELTLVIQFSQGVDSASLCSFSNYTFLETNNAVQQAKSIGPLFNQAELKLQSPLKPATLYKLATKNILSCQKDKSFEIQFITGLQKDPIAKDVIINEVLFNPPPDGKDFVELFNNSSSVINAHELYLSSYNQMGGLNTSYKLGEGNYNFFPNDYLIVTEDSSFVKKQWPSSITKKILQINTLPSMPDDAGNILLLNKQGAVLDKMSYTENMHYPFLHDPSGVSLERIDPHSSSEEKSNWHSASSSVNYATPTNENSQYKKSDSISTFFQVGEKMISPNNDGINDLLQINYRFNQPGYMCSIYVFGLQGNMITKIIDNKLMGTSGSIFWDGMYQQQRLPSGQYVVYAEAFHLKGKIVKEKILIAIR